jgi:WhiB family redox-sensing transcriptional regulator
MTDLLAGWQRPDWYDRAACRHLGPSLFFPKPSQRPCAAIEVCQGCPVLTECREYGLTQHHGVWGGLPEKGRRGIRRTRREENGPTRSERVLAVEARRAASTLVCSCGRRLLSAKGIAPHALHCSGTVSEVAS